MKIKLTEELTSVFEYINNNFHKEYPKSIINEYTFIWAILKNEDCLAYQSLSSIVMETTLDEIKGWFDLKIYEFKREENGEYNSYSLFDSYMANCNEICKELNKKKIDSSILFLAILKSHEDISKEMQDFSVTADQLTNSIKSSTALVEIMPKRNRKRTCAPIKTITPIKIIDNSDSYGGDIERNTTNISQLAKDGKIAKVFGYDKYYKRIFTVLSKKNINNVLVTGKSGVGKTSLVKNLANLINNNKCIADFQNKTLIELDFNKLMINTQFKGALEQKFYAIFEEAKSKGDYIFVIDDIELYNNQTDLSVFFEDLFNEPQTPVICTVKPYDYSALKKSNFIGRYLEEIKIEEPSKDETYEIINAVKGSYENFHNVIFRNDTILSCIDLCKKYFADKALPASALDTLDFVGAKVNIDIEENSQIKELTNKLNEIEKEVKTIKQSSKSKQYDKIDSLIKKEIEIKSQIAIIQKNEILSKKPLTITKEDVCQVLSEKTDIPLTDITLSEKEKLKGLNKRLKDVVIGQDDAIEEVCKAVKRQRVGLGEKERPAVFLFLGSTGTGKTYLAQQLAKEIFGDEKYFVRIDMSEYADKTSVNKIGGSSPGYVGYDHDTYFVKALKTKKRFILLLDEFEKSDEEVHNLFLQIFDEGRFTDSHGEEYSLKDVIIIMTSNVGVAEVANRGHLIGFGRTDYDFSKSIIESELKKKFKPEFLNRIQKIVYFNQLKDDNLKSIIKLEISKLNSKVENLGFHLSKCITEEDMVNDIYESISSQKEYGARPIVNEVQRQIEDKIVDYMIENEVEENHIFTYKELKKLENEA